MYFAAPAPLCRPNRPDLPMKTFDRMSDDEFAERLRQAMALPEAPADWIQRAIDAGPRPSANAVGGAVAAAAGFVRAAARRVVGLLEFDSWAGPALATDLRGARSETRQLLFNAEGRDIDLRLNPSTGGFSLTGQVLGPDESGLVLLQPESTASAASSTASATVPLDALGEFRFDDMAAGRYRLVLQLGGDEIVLSPIELGPAQDASDPRGRPGA